MPDEKKRPADLATPEGLDRAVADALEKAARAIKNNTFRTTTYMIVQKSESGVDLDRLSLVQTEYSDEMSLQQIRRHEKYMVGVRGAVAAIHLWLEEQGTKLLLSVQSSEGMRAAYQKLERSGNELVFGPLTDILCPPPPKKGETSNEHPRHER